MPPAQVSPPRRAFQLLIFLFAIVCICLVAIQPLLQGALPRADDGLLQMYRSVALHHSLRVDNPIWPRYASGLVYGYGAPLFNYFPPLSYYPAAWLHSFGFSFVDGWLMAMVLYTLLAALGMFLLARLWTRSDLGAWMAALAYIYAPFFLFDGLTRGSSPELAALAALPLVMFAFTRLAWGGRRRDLILTVASFALFIPLHTLITLHGTALLALYCLFLVCYGAEGAEGAERRDRRAVFLRLSLAGLLGLALTAFYWLPALLEADAIKLSLISAQLSHIDVKQHLRPLSEILSAPHSADPTQQNQAIPISLGWLQLILSAIALLLSVRAAFRRYLPLMLLIWCLALALVFMNTPPSAPLWDAIPLIALTQFPWRLLGLASLLLALGAGMGAVMLASLLPAGKSRAIALGFFSAIMPLYALPWTYIPYHADLAAEDIRDVQQFERAGGQLALSSYSEYLPRSVDASQLDAQRLVDRFAKADAIARLMPSDTLEILSQRWSGTSANLRLGSAKAQRLVFDWLYLPGWRAEIDGAALAVYPASPTGLVALDAPAGEFNLRIALSATATQSAAQWLSAIGALGFLAILIAWARLPAAHASASGGNELDMRLAVAFAALGFSLFLAKALVLDRHESPFQSYRFGQRVAAPAMANFANRIDLLAADLPTGELNQSAIQSAIGIKLYWRLHDKALERDYASLVRLRDAWGAVIAEASAYAPGGLATSNWLAEAYIEDRLSLEIPPFTPPLDEPYELEVALFDVDTLEALSVFNAEGNPADAKFALASLRYRPPDSQAAADDALNRADGAHAAVLGAVLYEAPDLPPAATVGDELRFSWAWRKIRAGASSLSAQLIWLDEETKATYASTALPLVMGYDSARWRAGEVLRGHHRLIVPPDLPAGVYALGLRLLDGAGKPSGQDITLDAAMKVAVPARQFDAPEYALELSALWDNGIVLHGYSTFVVYEENEASEADEADEAGGETGLELIWSTEQALPQSLRLFIHVLDERGMIAAQWDGVPVDWTRPTSGWLPGEYVQTRHHFVLSTGQDDLRIGWYDPQSSQRVGIDAGDALLLEDLTE